MQSRSSHWDHYWQQAQASGCIQQQASGYNQEIQQQWQHFFAQLPAASNILDLGTGNGAIPQYAQQFADSTQTLLNITGIDGAHIQPQLSSSDHCTVAFISNTAISHHSFQSNEFSALTAQYAVEYFAIPEVCELFQEVLQPSGYFQFIMHLKQGEAFKTGQNVLQCIQLFAPKGAFFTKLVKLIKEFKQPLQQQAITQLSIYKQFKKEVKKVLKFERYPECQLMVKNTIAVIERMLMQAEQHLLESMLSKIEEIQQGIEFHRQRIMALLNAAKDEPQLLTFVESLSPFCIQVDYEVLSNSAGKTLAWVVRGIKKPAK